MPLHVVSKPVAAQLFATVNDTLFASIAQRAATLVRDAGYAIVHDERTQVPWVPAARHWLGNVERRFPDGAPEGQLARLAGLCRGILAHGGSPTHIHLLVAEVEA